MLRLRQICLVAEKLAPIVDDLSDVLGLEVCYRDPVVAKYGLENALLPIGRDFLEVVAPVEQNTAAGRYLERRGGDGGYIVILQSNDAGRRNERYPSLNVRIANHMDYGDFLGNQLHPKDTGGCMLEVDRQAGDVVDGDWHPAGSDWERHVRTNRTAAMTGCTLQGQAPEALAKRWADILERPAAQEDGAYRIPLDNGDIRVVPPQDDRGDGMIEIDLKTTDKVAILAAAKARDLPASGESVTICGVNFNLL